MTIDEVDNRSSMVSVTFLFAVLSGILLIINDYFFGNYEPIYGVSLFFASVAFAVALWYIFITSASNKAKSTVSFIIAIIATALFVITVAVPTETSFFLRDVLKAVSGFSLVGYTLLTFFITSAKNSVRVQY